MFKIRYLSELLLNNKELLKGGWQSFSVTFAKLSKNRHAVKMYYFFAKAIVAKKALY